MTDITKLAVQNLVFDCAEVRPRNRVLILNEVDAVESEVADLIEAAVRASGADAAVAWHDPISVDAGVPKDLVGAMLAAHRIIFNGRISRTLLDRHFKGRQIVRINNYARTMQALTAADAQYSWRSVMATFRRIETIVETASRWHLASDKGTDLHGTIGNPTLIADAYFAREIEGTRWIRVFPGEVYAPVGSVDAEGTIVVEYINNRDQVAWASPIELHIRNNRIVDIMGGDSSRRSAFEAMIDANVGRYGDAALVVDSWHGGMNPKARSPGADGSLYGAGTSPAMMHVHLGRVLDPISAGILRPTVRVDGTPIIDRGTLAIDPANL